MPDARRQEDPAKRPAPPLKDPRSLRIEQHHATRGEEQDEAPARGYSGRRRRADRAPSAIRSAAPTRKIEAAGCGLTPELKMHHAGGGC
jgi:hypothetical protein